MNKFEEIARAKNVRISQDEELLSVLLKTLENVCAERAGQSAVYDDLELYAKFKAIKSGIYESVKTMSDVAATMATELFPQLNQNGELIKSGTRINWNGKIKRATSDLWDTAENNPDNAPALWENIDYKQGYRIIPETITVGTAFYNGEYGWWEDTLYQSVIDNNVWTPDAYPQGWIIIKE